MNKEDTQSLNDLPGCRPLALCKAPDTLNQVLQKQKRKRPPNLQNRWKVYTGTAKGLVEMLLGFCLPLTECCMSQGTWSCYAKERCEWRENQEAAADVRGHRGNEPSLTCIQNVSCSRIHLVQGIKEIKTTNKQRFQDDKYPQCYHGCHNAGPCQQLDNKCWTLLWS